MSEATEAFDTEETRELVAKFQAANTNIREQIAGDLCFAWHLPGTAAVGGHAMSKQREKR